jgi:pyochelin synthetase
MDLVNAPTHESNAHELLRKLSQQGVRLSLGDDGQLSVNAPKGALTTDLRAHITTHKATLMAALQLQSTSHELPQITPDFENLYEPFSPGDVQISFLMGERIDMQHHMRPHCYMESEWLDFDAARYETALNQALYWQRSNLCVVTPNLQLQTVREFTPIELIVQDLRAWPIKAAHEKMTEDRAQRSRQILPIDTWPWVDCGVTLYGNNQARVYWNNNNFHIDGYGTTRFLETVRQLYQNPTHSLPPLTLSFKDSQQALAKLEQSAHGQASKRYWLDRIPHFPSTPHLPLCANFNPYQRAYLERREILLPASTWANFKKMAANNQLTPGNALFSAYAQVLSHWSGSTHFLLNNMATHRLPIHPQIKEILGNFTSLYPLEVDWRGDQSFAKKAQRLQLQVITDLQYTHFSGVKVLQALNQLQQTPGHTPCPLVLGNGLFMQPFDQPSFVCLETSQVLLDHEFWELKNGDLWVVWDVIEACFPQGMMKTMFEIYAGFLHHLAENENAWQQSDFDLLPDGKKAHWIPECPLNQINQPELWIL